MPFSRISSSFPKKKWLLNARWFSAQSNAAKLTKANQKLRENERKYRSMMEAITDPCYICSHDLRIKYMNPAMVKKGGRNAVGENCHSVLYDEDERCPWCVFDQLQQGTDRVYEKKDPVTDRVYSINCSLVPNTDTPASMLTIFRDITEIKQMEKDRRLTEAKLQQAQKMEALGSLAGGIAHDFNNILTSILGYTEFALDEVERGTSLGDSLHEIYTAGNRAKDLVKQILTFARQSDEKKSPVQPGMIGKEVLKFIRSTIPASIEIQQDFESDALIMGKATQIHQIFMNLCTNAAHAMESSGGILKVGIKDLHLDKRNPQTGMAQGDWVEIQVSDTGVGISPDIIDSIFEPYFTTRGSKEGTGMGLSVVHGIVESHGGRITVDSQLGKGATFAIYLPVFNEQSDRQEHVPEQPASGTEHILFVDDEAAICKMNVLILESLGYKVTSRTSSIEALAVFKEKADVFDLVITDMAMPNITGDRLAAEMMKIKPDIPVILCTGYSETISDETASEIGIKAFAYKPIMKAELAQTVRKVLDEAKS
jgi:PAS domain S-box-containing protein